MLYLANPTSPKVREAMRNGLVGMMCTPAQGNRLEPGVTWAADNGCFGKGYPGDEAWMKWLHRMSANVEHCLFATAPDVIGDAAATLKRSAPWLPLIRALGYPAALVAQDGLEHLDVPWGAFDVLFIGGSTEWKLSAAARALVAEAKARGKKVHMGRVNSRRRWSYAEYLGCDWCDGTFMVFDRENGLERMTRWSAQPGLDFGGVA